MSVSDWAAAHPSLVVLIWPVLTAAITALWQRPSTAEIIASAGGRHFVLSAFDKAIYVAAALGIDSRSFLAWLRAQLTPKPPKPPPATPLTTEEIPVHFADPVPVNSNAGEPPTAARLIAFACVTVASIVIGAVMGCGAGAADVKAYAPSPADEEAFVEYATAEESCVLTDASKADKIACVQAVRCAHHRAEAGVCDGGSK